MWKEEANWKKFETVKKEKIKRMVRNSQVLEFPVDEEEGSLPQGGANRYNTGKIERSAEAFREFPNLFYELRTIHPL